MILGIIFSLIGLGVALMLLPLRIMNSLLGLALLPVKIIIKLLTRNLFLTAILVGVFLLYRAFNSGDAALPQLAPAPAAPAQQQAQQPGQAVVVEPVRKREDGDSNFATDLYATMTEIERTNYSANYHYAMTNTAPNEVYTWETGNINGALRPGAFFQNNSGVRCRRFSEVLKVHSIQQTLTGIACEQPGGAWCKLKPNATPACNLGGYKPGILESIGNLF